MSGGGEVLKEPTPHVLVASKKELHGWWSGIEPNGARECTAERLLINPYNGCSHRCFFCYAHAFPGYFERFRREGVVTVFKDFDKVVSRQLDALNVASCGYLSPVTDPFQPINKRYELTEKIIKEFVRRNLPVDVVTKGVVSNKALKLLKTQEHSFAQITIVTLDEKLRRKLMQGGASVDGLLRNIERLCDAGIFTVCRIDPVLPFVTDSENELRALVAAAKERGAAHIIASCLDIPLRTKSDILSKIEVKFGKDMRRRYETLFTERIGPRLHASIWYRKQLFRTLRDICCRHNVTFALCMEFERLPNGRLKGLNAEFKTSNNCEGINVPIYVRRGDRFEPVAGCDGNCLKCYSTGSTPACGISELAKAGAWKLRDYKRWGKEGERKCDL
ncbi:MAG: DNA repair photolyase [Candidatus Alkanophagales archaeon MCA70_species_2]|nr:DNA repair photolyase [Candidatus Alkanophaga liquidiphilum]